MVFNGICADFIRTSVSSLSPSCRIQSKWCTLIQFAQYPWNCFAHNTWKRVCLCVGQLRWIIIRYFSEFEYVLNAYLTVISFLREEKPHWGLFFFVISRLSYLYNASWAHFIHLSFSFIWSDVGSLLCPSCLLPSKLWKIIV